MPLKVFLGSSSEAKKEMAELAEWIEDFNHIPLTWTDPRLFPLGGTTFSSISQIAQTVDAAIFLFGEDDVTWYRGDKIKSPRDNVLLEYGLFSGSLGEQAVAIAKIGNPKLASDLEGVTYLSLNKKMAAKNKLQGWLDGMEKETHVVRSIARLRSPFQSSGKQSLFEQGTQLIQKATRRVALVAKTPILVVGTRPYGHPSHAISYEKEQFDLYMNLARAAGGSATPEFRCVSSISALDADINKINSDDFRKTVKANLNELYGVMKKKGSNFRLGWCEADSLTTFVVSDDTFLLWFKDSTGENVWITAENEIVARALWDQSEKVMTKIDLRDIENRLKM